MDKCAYGDESICGNVHLTNVYVTEVYVRHVNVMCIWLPDRGTRPILCTRVYALAVRACVYVMCVYVCVNVCVCVYLCLHVKIRLYVSNTFNFQN